MRPEHYQKLPKGVRCRCLHLWKEADGSFWCCIKGIESMTSAYKRPVPLKAPLPADHPSPPEPIVEKMTGDQKHVWRALQYEIEGVVLRRLHENRIQGYTLEMAEELTALYFAFRPDKAGPAVSNGER